MVSCVIRKTIHKRHPSVPFVDIADNILPKKYELSVVLIGDNLGKKLNKKYKNRNYPTNVLSFPLDSDNGELFLNIRKAEREASKFNHSKNKHIIYLFIHGCLHLAGYEHGSIMEKLEQKYLKQFIK